MRNFYTIASCVSALVSWAAFCVPALQAQTKASNQAIEVNVTTSFEPSAVAGLIISTQGARQIQNVEFKRISETALVVSVPYSESEIPRDSMASAIVLAEDGQMAFGDVRPILTQDPRRSYLSLPECPAERFNETNLVGQMSVLEALVQKRTQRRGVEQVRIAQILSDKFIDRLRKLERGLGWYIRELTPDLPPAELSDRLSRILEAVQAVKANAPTPAPAVSTPGAQK